jgi:hypothetical protein
LQEYQDDKEAMIKIKKKKKRGGGEGVSPSSVPRSMESKVRT